MKICCRCREFKSDEAFKSHPYCSECRSLYERTRYQRVYVSRKKAHDRVKRYRSKSKDIAYRFIYDHLSTHPCLDCGESDVVVLEFDHVRGEKTMSISTMLKTLCYPKALPLLSAEIDKCDVRCCNCHRRRTAASTGSWRTMVEQLPIQN